MVNRDVVSRKIASATARLGDADAILSRPVEDFLADLASRDLATFYLFLAIQDCIDLAAHWVSDAGWQPPADAGATFDVLVVHNTLDPTLADGMRAATGLRNRIAHGYASVDHRRLYDEYRAGVDTLRRFLSRVADEAGL